MNPHTNLSPTDQQLTTKQDNREEQVQYGEK